MKKWKTIFNVLIAIGIVGICYSSMYFEFNDKTIMSRNEAMRNYNNIVESSFSALLSDVGNIEVAEKIKLCLANTSIWQKETGGRWKKYSLNYNLQISV